MADTHTKGSLVWVKDATEGWVKGVVQQVRADGVDVKVESGATSTHKPEDAPLQNPSARMGVEVWSWVSYDGRLSPPTIGTVSESCLAKRVLEFTSGH